MQTYMNWEPNWTPRIVSSPNGPDMTSQGELVERYKQFRGVSFELNKILPNYGSKQTIELAARKLGLFQDGLLVFGEEDEVCVLMDYVIYDCYEDGANAVDRHIADHPPAAGSDEETVLRAMQEAFFAVVQVEEVLEGLGVRVYDLLSDRRFLLADIGFSHTAVEGVVLATRLVPFEEFVMTSGAALPLDKDSLVAVADYVADEGLADDPDAFTSLTAGQKATVTAEIIGIALEEDNSACIEYADVHEAGTYVPATPALKTSARVGRNDPCPCGSGKKYKKCCGG